VVAAVSGLFTVFACVLGFTETDSGISAAGATPEPVNTLRSQMLIFCTTVPSPSPDIPCHRSTLELPVLISVL